MLLPAAGAAVAAGPASTGSVAHLPHPPAVYTLCPLTCSVLAVFALGPLENAKSFSVFGGFRCRSIEEMRFDKL